jgi:hypothetical protein
VDELSRWPDVGDAVDAFPRVERSCVDQVLGAVEAPRRSSPRRLRCLGEARDSAAHPFRHARSSLRRTSTPSFPRTLRSRRPRPGSAGPAKRKPQSAQATRRGGRGRRRLALLRSSRLHHRHHPEYRWRQARGYATIPSDSGSSMSSPSPNPAPPITGLRANALAAVVMLLIQYCLGISVNLYSTPPAGDAGKSLFAGFSSAVGNGPLILSLHALLGTLLLITASVALVRSSRLGARAPIALTAVALLVIVVAWLAGSEFVGHMKNGTSPPRRRSTARSDHGQARQPPRCAPPQPCPEH